MEILKNLDWSPLFISIKTGIVATIFSFFLGIYAARKVVKTTPGKKAIIDGILTLPMVLPPTVAGFFLLLIFSRRRPFGIFLFENFGIKVVQTWLGCIIAATVISFPLMYRNARAAMEQIDVNLIYAGRTLGMSDTEIFWKVVIPTAGPGIASGTILTFARALGEYGATSMLAGNIPGKTGTISQKIAMVIQDGDYMTAGVWVAIVMVIAFLVIWFIFAKFAWPAVIGMLDKRQETIKNNLDEAEAAKTAETIGSLLSMAVKPGNSSIFVGKKEFEIMKKPGRGTHGHIAILTNNVDRAIYHLSQRGVKFDMDSKNVKDGKTIAIYFADEVAGFAIHLVQK